VKGLPLNIPPVINACLESTATDTFMSGAVYLLLCLPLNSSRFSYNDINNTNILSEKAFFEKVFFHEITESVLCNFDNNLKQIVNLDAILPVKLFNILKLKLHS